jgi:N-acyl-D-amino-acid deacylase
MLLVGFRNEALRPLIGHTLADVAAERGVPAAEAAMDLVVQDESRVQVVYHSMSEENVRRKITLPWMSFGSDARSLATEGVFLQTSTHPRAYGTFARLLGRYVRDEDLIPLREAIRRLTSFPASRLRLDNRGSLLPGFYADVVIFDPDAVQDHATFESPHHYSSGVRDVLVNGVAVLRHGEHTGALPGRVLTGPGTKQ